MIKFNFGNTRDWRGIKESNLTLHKKGEDSETFAYYAENSLKIKFTNRLLI